MEVIQCSRWLGQCTCQSGSLGPGQTQLAPPRHEGQEGPTTLNQLPGIPHVLFSFLCTAPISTKSVAAQHARSCTSRSRFALVTHKTGSLQAYLLPYFRANPSCFLRACMSSDPWPPAGRDYKKLALKLQLSEVGSLAPLSKEDFYTCRPSLVRPTPE